MDTPSLIIGFAIALLCLLPILLMARAQRKTKNRIKQIFTSYEEGSFSPGLKELHFKKLYALDEKNQIFLFADLNHKSVRTHFIDLKEVRACKMEEYRNGEDLKIVFVFTPLTKKEAKEIILYDSTNENLGKAYWTENKGIAQKWQTIIGAILITDYP